ncbi:hypothetical protein [Mycobacteroides abscessus]|uniref:hypothetical protein n=1 Tax=Mycobacteroides abscessus TaxID=36809 RepID=UPI000C259D3E|nr:hypothetical protein [Mycobacteroides abscessus]
MPLAEGDPYPKSRPPLITRVARGQLLTGAVIALITVVVSLSLAHCSKGVAALSQIASVHDGLARSAPQSVGATADTAGMHSEPAGSIIEQQGGRCGSADVVLFDDSVNHARPLLAPPAITIAFTGPPEQDPSSRPRRRPGDINPSAALSGRSLLYRLSVIRR